MFTVDQIIAHAVGDYILQSDWMANNKTKQHAAALAHALAYSLPFILLSPSYWALLLITGTHFLIDRYRLARYVCWFKNILQPQFKLDPWGDCKATGYPSDRPAWLSVWLLIITDNLLHIIINALALRFL